MAENAKPKPKPVPVTDEAAAPDSGRKRPGAEPAKGPGQAARARQGQAGKAGKAGPGAQGKARAANPAKGAQAGSAAARGAGAGAGAGAANRPAKAPGPVPVVEIRPIAQPARMRRRHWGLVIWFLLWVVVPLVLGIYYLLAIAEDQYSSTVGFTVRSEEGASASDLLGGLASFTGTGSGGGGEGDILYEFIQSQEIVERVNEKVDLVGHYTAHWKTDPVFALWPDPSIEDLVWYWKRVVRVSYDKSSGLTSLEVLAFDPDMAQKIAQQILVESQEMINRLNEAGREDAMRYALADLDTAVERLKSAREALTKFRTRTQIVDPTADIEGRMGVLNNLQQQLAQALIDYDLLQETVSPTDPRLKQALRRIEVIQGRIAKERESFASETTASAGTGEDYPEILAEFESLTVDREFAEETYRAALAALDAARAKAQRQSRYLSAFIEPTRAQSSEYPQRTVYISLLAMILILSWGIMALIYYSIRDRR